MIIVNTIKLHFDTYFVCRGQKYSAIIRERERERERERVMSVFLSENAVVTEAYWKIFTYEPGVGEGGVIYYCERSATVTGCI